jgi:formylglycine-generating enzyme required for sulfatase activity
LVKIEKPFFIAITPITQQQYFDVIGRNPSKHQGPNTKGLAATHPVERVSWYEAISFCEKLTQIISSEGRRATCRLPSEAEWEYACRAGTKTLQYFGDDESLINQYAWQRGNSSLRTHPVGELKPNAYGLYDMSGNVFELCQDWYDHSYHHLPDDFPKPAPRMNEKVMRGGSFQHDVAFCRPETRFYAHPEQSQPFIGFRIVVTT